MIALLWGVCAGFAAGFLWGKAATLRRVRRRLGGRLELPRQTA
jgi:hypothetical protein